nr:TMV resistance protein N-like isoform X1 [Malus domestica]
MELIGFIQVFNIIIIAIGTLLYMCCRPFSSSSSATDSAVVDSAAVADDDDADIPPCQEKYDVFISFRGEDTRRTFTSHLHAALLAKKITTYIDDKLKRGDEIKPALRKAIEESELSVIIFSKDYASSTWCLDELVHILECKEKHGQLVIPIFYDTLPSDVRKQRGSYALDPLEQRFENSIDKVRKWRVALTHAANISGFDSKDYRTDADLVKKVVEDILTKLCYESSCDLEGLVGIESRIEQIESLLGIHSQDACISVGIWGMGGIGKTTLAEAVFNRLSSKFEACCFLRNVREREQKDGLEHLQNTLLSHILKEEGLSIGSTFVRDRLSCTKVLIVLDDVSDSMQMEGLAGNRLRFGNGSRIIITSRNKGTLRQTVEKDKIYEVGRLNPDDALQLFCSRAFKNTRITDYKGLAEKVMHIAGGIPLALILLRSSFLNCKSKADLEDELDKLKQFPNENIQRVLRLSYDGLRRNEKEIFLDIACFHKGHGVDEVKQLLDVRGFSATVGIRILSDMSLISIGSRWGRETIEMHDLLEEMGRTIVQEQCIEDPSKRSRLFNDKDVYHVLKSNKETSNVEAIFLNYYNIAERPLKRIDFKLMSNLRLLIVDGGYKINASLDLPDSLRYLYWPRYPMKSLPSNFCPENLVELHMPNSKVKKLWKEDQRLVNLKVIDLSRSTNLTEVPSLSGSLKIVNINLCGCESLVEIHGCFQHLDKLTRLDLGDSISLNYLPKMPRNIKYLDLEGSGIKELPESVWSNENISYLNIGYCYYLEKLPSNSCKLKVSGSFDLYGCISLREFSEGYN